MHSAAVAFFVVIVILIVWQMARCYRWNWSLREALRPGSGTRIYRGVGFGNDADETPVAAGVVRSAPVFDMTHTYWDGVAHTSCDECPNTTVCPSCPQSKRGEHFVVRGGGEMQRTRVLDSYNVPVHDGDVEPFAPMPIAAPRAHTEPPSEPFSGEPERYGGLIAHGIDVEDVTADATRCGVLPDVFTPDPDYVSSRERMGAVTCGGLRARKVERGASQPSDEGRSMHEGAARPRSVEPGGVLGLLYGEVMGLSNCPYSGQSCELRNSYGYLYDLDCSD